MSYRSVDDAMETLGRFVEERNWGEFHTLRNLAASISVEAGELLETVQWGEEPDREAMAWELADILCYAFHLCKELDQDPVDLIEQKIARASLKYPAGQNLGSGRRTMAKIEAKDGAGSGRSGVKQ